MSKSLALEGVQYVNIPDSASSEELPFDGVINYKGSFVGFEAKRLVGYKAFNPKMLRDSQIRGLTSTVHSGGTAVVGLFIWEPRKYNRMIYWEWRDFLRITENLTKSIKAKDLKDLEYCDCKKKRFDLENFLKFLDRHTVL